MTYADTDDFDSDPAFQGQNYLFVSLGSLCRTANTLRACGLRVCAFPFDWIISTDGEKLIELLDKDFDGFITDEMPFIENSVSLERGGLTLLHPYYHLEFTHESSKSQDGSYFVNWDYFHSKFRRRIERFRLLENFKGKVFFIRSSWLDCTVDPYLTYRNYENTQISKEYGVKLFDALTRRFPNLDFSLIIQNDCFGREVYGKKIQERLWFIWRNPEPVWEALPEAKQFYQEILEYWHLTFPETSSTSEDPEPLEKPSNSKIIWF